MGNIVPLSFNSRSRAQRTVQDLDSRMEGAPSEGPTGNAAPGIDRRPQDSRKGKANMHGIQPIGLKGHTRSITCVQYNRDSDLLFTCVKDSTPTLWYTGNGERVGTFNGHTGANTKLHVSADSSLVMTGSADMYAKLWNVRDGTCIKSFRHSTPVRAVGINLGNDQVLCSNDPVMKQEPSIFIYDVDEYDDGEAKDPDAVAKPVVTLLGHSSKINQAIWGPMNETIFSCSDDGTVKLWNPEARKCIGTIDAHEQKNKHCCAHSNQMHQSMLLQFHPADTISFLEVVKKLLMSPCQTPAWVNSKSNGFTKCSEMSLVVCVGILDLSTLWISATTAIVLQVVLRMVMFAFTTFHPHTSTLLIT